MTDTSTATSAVATTRDPGLLGQTVVVIGGSSGIGLETARQARAEGADVVLTGRNPERLQAAKLELSAAAKMRPAGTLLSMVGTGARKPGVGLGVMSSITAALPALTANLALELAPVRVNLIAAGFVDTPLSASVLGDELERRRDQLRATLPIRRVIEPADVAALAIHIMTNTAITGATFDIDGGEQLLAGDEES
jgi:NAD(P)-dependent dehydrogenase (short-subunit alcohol dehydrogenase family)